MRFMHWNIYNAENGQVLTWDDKAIDFKTKEDAVDFVNHSFGIDIEDTKIEEGILYYDGGYIPYEEVKETEDYKHDYNLLEVHDDK